MSKKPVCAVLGASGFLGSGALPELREAFTVVGTSMRPRGEAFRAVDLRERDALARFLDEVQPDVVIALAAYREPDFCEDHPEETRRLNTRPVVALTELLPATTPLLFVSTDYVFDGKAPPYRPDAPRHPLSEYGKSKAEAEDALRGRDRSIVLRVPLLMGWTESFDQSGFFSQLIADLRATEPRPLDDVLKRYPVWTRDVGIAMRHLLTGGHAGTFHFSTTRPLTRYRAALEMAELIGWPTTHLTPSATVIPRRATRPDDAHLDMTDWLARGFPPPTDFREVAHRFLLHFGVLPTSA
ncbi:MAG TPA: SDR family oxidoreductase [Kiritimatiellia bacterium]|nr:SDR family oxidoreductase [Kiritimatiellia bacterium]HMP33844.1 SDR family oxidoreductase [Kiritimatiellia bacterium]